MIVMSRCHDSVYQGTRTAKGLTEWQACLDICQGTTNYLNKLGCLSVTMTKGTLGDRIKCINELGKIVECAIEPHFNWINIERMHGCSVICWHESEPGEKLATYICEAIAETGLHSRGINKASRTKRWIGTQREYNDKRLAFLIDLNCVSVIPEICYFSNTKDARFIADPKNRIWIGSKIGEGVIKYLQEAKNV